MLLLSAGPARTAGSEAEWPHLRGPGYDALTGGTDLARSLPWPSGGPPVLWKTGVGQGYSGFAVVADRVYTQAQDRTGQSLVCLDLHSGALLWSVRYGDPWEYDGPWPGPYASPTYARGRVVFAGCHGTVGCADAADGRLLWRVAAKERFDGQGTDFGYSCSPLVVDDRVILPMGGIGAAVIALDLETGEVVWTAGDEHASYSSSLPISVGGKRQVVSVLARYVVAHDPGNGRELWRHQLAKRYNPKTTWPLYSEPFLFGSFALRRGALMLRLGHRGGEPVAEQVWHSSVMSNDIFSSLLHDGHVYGFDVHDPQSDSNGKTKGELKCIELASGRQCWATPRVAHAAVLGDGEHLILFTEQGDLVIAEATPADYRELARAAIFPGELCWTQPALIGNRLLVRGQQHVACLFLGDPDAMPATSATTASGSQGIGIVEAWTRRYHDQSFWGPAPGDLLRWYLVSLLGVLVPAWLCALPLATSPRTAFTLLPLQVLLLGFGGMPLATELAGRLVFTWPAGLFVAFLVMIAAGVRAQRDRTGKAAAAARLAAVAFAGICLAYSLVCGNLGLVCGWGFLIGFLPAWPLSWMLARRLLDRQGFGRLAVLGLAAYTVFFWSAALLYALKTGIWS